MERASAISRILFEFGQEYPILNESYFSLLAIESLTLRLTRNQVLERVKESDWLVRHEVLARWAWMKAEQELLATGGYLEHPLLCRVEKRNRDRRARLIGREFYSLILFLHQIKASTGEELLYLRKGETPDFILEDTSGNVVGAEMSEVPHSEQWSHEMDAESIVLDTVREAASHLSLSITIEEPTAQDNPRFWRNLAERAEDLKSWLNAELSSLRETKSVLLENPTIGIRVVAKGSDHGLIIWTQSLRGETAEDDARNEEEISNSLYSRLRAKIFKKTPSGKERLRQTPSARPCHLVLYPNTNSFGSNAHSIAGNLKNRLDFDPTTHFDHIWLSDEKMIMPLL